MKTPIKWMLLAGLALISLYAQARPTSHHPRSIVRGGDSGGGSGGDKRPQGWTSAIPGTDKITFTENYDTFYEQNPQSIYTCPNKSRLPLLTEVYKNKIVVHDDRGRELDLNKVCKDKKLALAYASIIANLFDLQQNEVFLHLVNQTISTGKPIEYRVVRTNKKVTARGERLLEFTWSDADSDAIYWSPRTAFQGLSEAFLARRSSAYIVHEVAHAFTKRRMGGYEKVEYWHDNRQRMQVLGKDGYGIMGLEKGSNIMKFETSAYAAFLESYSNILEGMVASLRSNEMVEDITSAAFYLNKENGRYQTFEPIQFRAKTDALLANEGYITSVLALFVGHSWVDEKELTVYSGTSPTVLKALIDGFPSREQMWNLDNGMLLFTLLRNVDSILQNDNGQRLAREFFLRDITENVSVRPMFEVVATEDNLLTSAKKTYATSIEQGEKYLFYSPVHEAQRLAMHRELENFRASKTTLGDLLKRLGKVKEQNARVEATNRALPRLEVPKDKWPDDTQIYQHLESARHLLPLMDIWHALQDLENPAKAQETESARLAELTKSITAVEEKINASIQDSQNNTAPSAELLLTVEKIEKEAQAERLRNQALVSAAIEVLTGVKAK